MSQHAVAIPRPKSAFHVAHRSSENDASQEITEDSPVLEVRNFHMLFQFAPSYWAVPEKCGSCHVHEDRFRLHPFERLYHGRALVSHYG